ncbi:MAG: hypothetical protein IIA44_08145 [Acidobacteria bacterium]|nr:hypothetical protein [Acidobacteriota bacterium]
MGSAQDEDDPSLEWISTNELAVPPGNPTSAAVGKGNVILLILHDADQFADDPLVLPEVTVETSKDKIKIKLATTAADGHYQLELEVVATVTDKDATPPRIRGRQSGAIEITYDPFGGTGFGLSISVKVDEEGPKIEASIPDDKSYVDDQSVTFRGNITDEDSKLPADDGKTKTLADGVDDADNLVNSTIRITWRGKTAADAKVKDVDDEDIGKSGVLDGGEFDPEPASANLDRNIVVPAGLLSVIENADGDEIGYEVGALLKTNDEGRFFWQLVATDRAGNQTFGDINRFDVDSEKPKISEDDSKTGVKWDSVKEKEKASRKSIRIQFVSSVTPGNDTVDEDTVSTSDFLVDGVQPKDVTVVEDDGLVYLGLSDELDPNAEPTVALVGTVRDLGGNAADLDSIKPPDGIAPELEVSLTGQPDGKILVANDEITINITSDEETTAAPIILIFLVKSATDVDDAAKDVLVAAAGGEAKKVPGKDLDETTADLAWTFDLDIKDDLGNVEGLYVIRVEDANDEADNEGKFGPKAGDVVDLDDDEDVFFEVDLLLNDGKGDIISLPDALNPGEGGDETDSTSPVIKIEFGNEGKEYVAAVDTGFSSPITLNDAEPDVDSHSSVDLIKVEFGPKGDTEDVTDQVSRSEKDEFFFRPFGLEEDTVYEMVVTARDEVGNTSTTSKGEADEDDATEFTFEFTVVERKAYKVGLAPGWNLISLPGTPVEPGLDDVLPDDLQASRILQWVDGAFEVNERQSDGTWDPSGGVTEVVAGPGYWILTTAFEDIETLIPERNPATVLPTIPIVGGWNLIGVIDLAQGDAGDDLPGTSAGYMASIDELVVYGFDTITNTFGKVAGTDPVVIGKGYWVWADKAGTLVP